MSNLNPLIINANLICRSPDHHTSRSLNCIQARCRFEIWRSVDTCSVLVSAIPTRKIIIIIIKLKTIRKD